MIQRSPRRRAEKSEGDDAHRFLRIVRAVADRHERRADELQPSETHLRRVRRYPIKRDHDEKHQGRAESETEQRRRDHRHNYLRPEPLRMPRRVQGAPLEHRPVEIRGPTRPAPQSPPISAWLELEGRPSHHVTSPQMIAASSASSTVNVRDDMRIDQADPDRRGHGRAHERSNQVARGGEKNGLPGRQHLGRGRRSRSRSPRRENR